MSTRFPLIVILCAFVYSGAIAGNPPLQLSLRFPDIPYAAISGTEGLVLNPASLFLNQEVSVAGYHSFGKDDFNGDNGYFLSAAGLGVGYQRLSLGLTEPVKRYDFAASSKLIRNFYTGISYTYYKSDWKDIDKAHAWNYSLLFHAHRMLSVGFQAQNINKHKFYGEKSAIGYILSTAFRPRGEMITIGANVGMYSGQKMSDANWRLSARAKVKKGLSIYAGIDNLGTFGAGLEMQFGRVSGGGESFFDNDAEYTGSTIHGSLSAAKREQLISQHKSILHVDLSGEIPEEASKPFLWTKPTPTVFQKLSRIKSAKTDPEVRGLFLTIRNPAIGWGRLSDFRETLKDFRRSGKPVVAYLGASPGNGAYFLASAADKIYMLPVDALYLTGLRAEVTFYKGAMDKLGIEAEMERSGKYKSYPEVFTDTTMSPEFREAVSVVLDDLYEQITNETAAGRGLRPEALREMIDKGPFTSTQAESLRLVDGRFYSHEFETKIPEMFGSSYDVIPESQYTAAPKFRERFCEPPEIALITVEGGIVKGGSGSDIIEGSTSGSATVASAVRAARIDPAVRAIVVRMNTPGGDAIASDLIWGELNEARKSKPVIVSMSDVCASGGYYIAAASDQVFLQPTTVTGSIGVFSGKANLSELYSKVGLHTETITRGKHANMFSWTQPFSDEERSIVKRQVSDLYTRFASIVADGRKLAIDSVRSIGQGRVWSGQRALELGLADTVGSVLDAIEMARQRAQIKDDDYVVVEMPQRKFVPRLTNLALSTLARSVGIGGDSPLAALRSLGAANFGAEMQMRMPYQLKIE